MTAALITGGAGAIGTYLASHLQAKGLLVVIIDDLSSGYKGNVSEKSTFYEGSILDDALLEHSFKKHTPSYVFHLAALFANQNSVEHPSRDLEVNGLGTLKVLEKSLQYNTKKVIYTSSSCVYGNLSNMDEDQPTPNHLDTPYAITKALGERYCEFFSTFHGLDTVIARLFNGYGPHERPGQYRNVIPNFFQHAIRKEPLVITGTGEETRDFTFVEDIAEGLFSLALNNTKPADIFNIGSGIETSIQTLVNAINKLTDNPAPTIHQPRRAWDHVSRRVANIEKAKSHIAYQPKTDLLSGLAKTHEWLKKNTF